MKCFAAFLGVSPLLLLLACSNPADNVPSASVSSPNQEESKPTAPAEANGQYFAISTDSSSIEFTGSKVTGSHSGGFRNFAGEFRVVDGKLAGTGNKVVISIDSMWSDNNRLTGHLKSADFFDSAQYPTAKFESTSIEQGPSGATVTGNLTMHGVTKSITFPAQIQVDSNSVSVTAEFSINRFDFEMKYPGKADDLIRKEVVLKLNVKSSPGRADFKGIESAPAAPTA